MYAALRKGPPTGASLFQRFFCWLIQERLVSQYSHGGIVIDGWLYHVTAAHGYQELAPGEWTPERWDITDIGGDDARAIEIFHEVRRAPEGWRRHVWRLLKGYDWFSLLAFVLPGIRVWWLNYCFELMWLMRIGLRPTGRVTPETILTIPIQKKDPQHG